MPNQNRTTLTMRNSEITFQKIKENEEKRKF